MCTLAVRVKLGEQKKWKIVENRSIPSQVMRSDCRPGLRVCIWVMLQIRFIIIIIILHLFLD